MNEVTDIRTGNIDKCVSSFNNAYQKTLIVMCFLFVLTDKNITADSKNEIGIPFVGVKAPSFTVGTLCMLLFIIFGCMLLNAYLLLKKNIADIPSKFPEEYKVMQDTPSWFLLKEKVRAVVLLMVIIFFKILAAQSYVNEPSFWQTLLPLIFCIPHFILLFIFIIEDAKKKAKTRG